MREPLSAETSDRRDADARDLDTRIRRFIARTDAPEIGFDRLALDLFAYQFEHNEPYRRYCRRMERTPNDVRHWREIPAIPAAAFSELRLACFPSQRAALAFESSGTTTGGARPTRHELEDAGLYDASLLTHFRKCVIPDSTSMTICALAPSFSQAPHSSLSYMLSKIDDVFGESGGGFFIRDDALDFAAACATLRRCSGPAAIIGTAFAFIHFIDRADAEGVRFELPLGSRMVETGGFKGRSREVPRDELYAALSRVFGVPRVFCVSEYGMCELGSQWYDANLADYFAGRAPRPDTKIGPRWARTLVVDPVTAAPVAAGASGLLAHYDLSNRGSVMAVLTGDLGRESDGGFELLGRHRGAAPKGCSIAIDAMLDAERG